MTRTYIALCASLISASCAPLETNAMSEPSVSTPIIIAHRGLPGEWPEHTIAGYAAAIEAGADYIEPDLVLTKDGVLVARHENEISDTTDVADHPEFADRKTSKVIDGTKMAGWFTEDFTIAELKTLRAKERLPLLRSTARDGLYEVPTFVEILELLAQVNKGRAKPVGVYPETKHPSYFTAIGLPHETPLLALLGQYGYRGKDAMVFIQSFEVGNLKAIRAKSDLPLIQLLDEKGAPADNAGTPYSDMASAEGLRDVARYANGIGPNKSMVIPRTAMGNLGASTHLVKDAHAAGLKVHPWTFRRENFFVPSAMKSGINPASKGDVASEIRAFLNVGIDGLFTDNTPEAAAEINAM